ncbi:hypothetical protein J6590_097483 [Homalodisca vitripennis]|nr:hypothetical protein J6590_097483 [Homalodisca vitripennis]
MRVADIKSHMPLTDAGVPHAPYSEPAAQQKYRVNYTTLNCAIPTQEHLEIMTSRAIPVTSNEDVLTIVKDVGRALDLTISDTMMDACHRLGAKQSGNNSPGIIVKFVRRLDKLDKLDIKKL